jgi:pimeloyl-ACP methyl ester carboxylesterase
MIEVNGVELCTESFGDPSDPALLLVMGVGASMLWWEEGFCRLLAGGGRFVIRYDHRDTGRSVTYEPGCPRYTGADLVADAVGVLDVYGIPAAHVVGVSAGGAFAQLLALGFPDRVLSLTLISTSPATAEERSLPSPTERFNAFLASAEVVWSERRSVVDYVVGYQRMLAGGARPFDEAAWRELVRRDVERARDIAASHETRSPSGFLTGSGRRSFHPEGAAPRMLAPDHEGWWRRHKAHRVGRAPVRHACPQGPFPHTGPGEIRFPSSP